MRHAGRSDVPEVYPIMGAMPRGRARSRDKNEPGIIAALEAAGATVVVMDKPLDLLVGHAGETYLLEVKNGNQPPSWQRVTADQTEFFDNWHGKPAVIVRTIDDALTAINGFVSEADRAMLASTYDAAGEPL